MLTRIICSGYNEVVNNKKEFSIGLGLLIIFFLLVFLQFPKNKPLLPNQEKSISMPTISIKSKKFNKIEVLKHNNQDDCWLIISNNVYDATDYLYNHPGGAMTIIPYCGSDATVAYQSERKHGFRAEADLSRLLIGSVE